MADQKLSLLMTRPEGSNAGFVGMLPPRVRSAVEVIESPLLSIESLGGTAAPGPQEEALFSSSNGVRFAPPGDGRRAWCVGARTTASAHDAGWEAVHAGDTAADLIRRILAERPAADLVHLSGAHTRGAICESLQAAGLRARRIVLYDQQLLSLSPAARALFDQPRQVIVPLFSPRIAVRFVAECPAPEQVIAVFLSDAVAAGTGQTAFLQRITAGTPDAVSMAASIEKLFR
ncbi:uroporphyrinogen-III synthase [Roseobacter sp.]|uniref:uroporphyrinogen-III synthase n=1 Tax=Roseobacter sp. TaxID=1907202 RepID=UPI0025DE6F4C|nr:uroporphyrinogen-III synthase [Roseobacter sp.]